MPISVDELRFDASIRDSRLRFYFRSAGAPYAVPTQHPGDNIAAQFPDRLSVSLHKGTRRIVLPAEHLTAVHFNRVDGHVRIEGDGWAAVSLVVTFKAYSSLRKFGQRNLTKPLRLPVRLDTRVPSLVLPRKILRAVSGRDVKSLKFGSTLPILLPSRNGQRAIYEITLIHQVCSMGSFMSLILILD